MKRRIVMLSVGALMVVIIATSVAPAFAGGWVATQQINPFTSETVYIYCRAGDTAVFASNSQEYAADSNGNFWVCQRTGSNQLYDDKTAFAGGWVANRVYDPVIGGSVTIYCKTGDQADFIYGKSQEYWDTDRNSNFWVCVHNGSNVRLYDDRIF